MPNNSTLLLIDKQVVEQLLVPEDVIATVREAFLLHSAREGRGFPVVREALASGAIFGIKSGDVQSQGLLGFKAAGFWPANRAQGSEAHQATIILFDPATGRPQSIIDGNAITTARTAAAGAIALQTLARPESSHITVFGTGVQATAQLRLALQTLPALTCLRYLSHDRKADLRFEAQFPGWDIACATDANAAVAQSDVVITATPGSGPLFAAEAVRPGTHLNCVGADTRGKRELPPKLLELAHRFVDDREQAGTLGEHQWASQLDCTEIGDLLAGKTHFVRRDRDITVFDMTGLALQDLTVGRFIAQRASIQDLGQRVAWPW